MTQKNNSIQKCGSCGKRDFVTDNETGEIFCKKCGYVIPEQVNETNSIPYNVEECSTGSPTSLAKHDMGLSTVIGSKNTDSTGKPLSTSMKKHVRALKLHDGRSLGNPSADRSFRIAFNHLLKLKDKLTLSDIIIEDAARIYRKAVEKNLIRGRSISALMASALYAACRDTETPRNLKDVEQAANIKRKDIARCYRLLIKELDLKMPVTDSIQCVARIASKIGIQEKTKRHAINVLKLAQKNEISAGKDPMGLAAAALYLSCVKNGEDKTQRDIAEAANVTEVTIRNRYKGLKDSQ